MTHLALPRGPFPAFTRSRTAAVLEDARKVPAFFRRDLITLWSYRTGFFSDWVNLVVQVLVFWYMSRLVPAERLPVYAGEHVSYIAFVTVALTVTSFMQVSLGRLVTALRSEQLMGTLESLLVTPTAPTTLQLGSVTYDLLYVPIRTAVFLALMVGVFQVPLELGGLLPLVVIIAAFLPFLWGLGILSGAAIVAFRHGTGAVGIGTTLLMIASGAFVPLEYLPGWVESAAQWNPMAIAIEGARAAMLGGAGWSVVLDSVVRLLPLALVTLPLGITAFRAALERERRRGTLGLY